MFSNDSSYRKSVYTLFFLAVFLTATTSPGFADAVDSPCSNATELDLNATLRSYEGEERVRLFRLALPAAGVAAVDLATPAPGRTPVKIDLFRSACEASDREESVTVLSQSPTHLVLAVRTAATLVFRAAAEHPQEPLGRTKLTTSYVEAEVVDESFGSATQSSYLLAGMTRKGDPEIVDPDPDGLTLDGGRLLASLLTFRPRTAAHKGDPEIVDPDPDGLRANGAAPGGFRQVVLYEPTCVARSRDEVDDHADTTSCATPLGLGRSAVGEIRNGWGDDSDVFALTLTELATVEITTTGDTDTFGVLYDRRGQRLAADDDGAGERNFRLLTTLAPGRYFVRVEGSGGAEGVYQLVVTTRGW